MMGAWELSSRKFQSRTCIVYKRVTKISEWQDISREKSEISVTVTDSTLTNRDRDRRSSARQSVWRQELFSKLVRSEFGCFEGNEWPRHPKSKLIPPLYLVHDDDDEGGNWGHHSLVFALRLFGVEIRNYPVKYISLKIDALGGFLLRRAQEKSLNN